MKYLPFLNLLRPAALLEEQLVSPGVDEGNENEEENPSPTGFNK